MNLHIFMIYSGPPSFFPPYGCVFWFTVRHFVYQHELIFLYVPYVVFDILLHFQWFTTTFAFEFSKNKVYCTMKKLLVVVGWDFFQSVVNKFRYFVIIGRKETFTNQEKIDIIKLLYYKYKWINDNLFLVIRCKLLYWVWFTCTVLNRTKLPRYKLQVLRFNPVLQIRVRNPLF